MKRILVLALALSACAAHASTNAVTFRLGDFLNNPVPGRRMTVTPISVPNTNGAFIVIGDQKIYTNDATATVVLTNVLPGFYRINFEGQLANSVTIGVPDSNAVWNASELITPLTTGGSPLAAYSQAAANAKFVLRESGTASNLNLQGPVTWNGDTRTEWPTGGGGSNTLSPNQFATTNGVQYIKKNAVLQHPTIQLADATGRALTVLGDVFLEQGFYLGNGGAITNLNGASIQIGTIETNAMSSNAYAAFIGGGGGSATNEWATNVAGTIYVAPRGSDSWPGTLLFPKASLSNALQIATPGTRIFMQPETFTSYIVSHGRRDGMVPIPCYDKTNIFIDAVGAVISWPTGALSGIAFQRCKGITVRGLELRGYRTDPAPTPFWASNTLVNNGVWGLAEVSDCEKMTFDGVKIVDSYDHGLLVDVIGWTTFPSTNRIVIRNSYAERCGMVKNLTLGIQLDGAGFVVSGGTHFVNNETENCTSGVEVYPIGSSAYSDLPPALIVGNTFRNSRGAGINVQGCPVVVVGNSVTYRSIDNYWTNAIWDQNPGLFIASSPRSTISGNFVSGHFEPFRISTCSNVSVTANSFVSGNRGLLDTVRAMKFSLNQLADLPTGLAMHDVMDSDFVENTMLNVGTNHGWTGAIYGYGIMSNLTFRTTKMVNDVLPTYALGIDAGASAYKIHLLDNSWAGTDGEYAMPVGGLEELRALNKISMAQYEFDAVGGFTNLWFGRADGFPIPLSLGDPSLGQGIALFLEDWDGSEFDTLGIVGTFGPDYATRRNLRAADGYFNGTVHATTAVVTASITLGGDTRTTWPSGSGGSATNAIGTVQINGSTVTNATTTLNIANGTNTTAWSTNEGSGKVTVKISANPGAWEPLGTNALTGKLASNVYGQFLFSGMIVTNPVPFAGDYLLASSGAGGTAMETVWTENDLTTITNNIFFLMTNAPMKTNPATPLKILGSGATTVSSNQGVYTISTSAASGEANTASTLGTNGLYRQKVGVDLQFASISGTNGMLVRSNANYVELDPSGVTNNNLGSGWVLLATNAMASTNQLGQGTNDAYNFAKSQTNNNLGQGWVFLGTNVMASTNQLGQATNDAYTFSKTHTNNNLGQGWVFLATNVMASTNQLGQATNDAYNFSKSHTNNNLGQGWVFLATNVMASTNQLGQATNDAYNFSKSHTNNNLGQGWVFLSTNVMASTNQLGQATNDAYGYARSMTNNFRLTNLFDVAPRGFAGLASGQVLKYNGTWWTNLADDTSVGAGNLSTNDNQFGAAGAVLTIKDGALLTNVTGYGTSTFADLSIGQLTITTSAVFNTLTVTNMTNIGGITFAGGIRQTNATTNVTVAAGTAITVGTNVTGSNVIYTINSTATGGTPSGTEGMLQFNDAGSMAGATNAIWDETNRVLTVDNATVKTNLIVGSVVYPVLSGSMNGVTMIGNTNDYFEFNIWNTNAAFGSSSDVTCTASNGTATTRYVSMGINGSTGGKVPWTNGNYSYLYSVDDPLFIGSLGSQASMAPFISFNVGGGTNTPSEKMLIDSNAIVTVRGSLSVATNVVVTNTVTATAMRYALQMPPITASNLVLSFNTNRYQCDGLTNIVLTNIVEEVHGATSADLTIFVRNTNGVNCPIVWPAYGAQHGYFFRTNLNNPVLSWAAVTNGKSAVISMTCYGTNVFATISEWP